MYLGSRVVRGRDWKTRKSNSSDDVGLVGTIVNLHHFQDGRPLPGETVLVHWDTGEQSCCRAGKDGYYDLRILDSAPAGVKFHGFWCDVCQQGDIAGMRWQCAVCSNVSLCTWCYMNDMHDIRHCFVRFDNPSDKYDGIELGERSNSFKNQSKGIFPGAKVRTKRDLKCTWTSPVLIGGDVLEIMTWDGIPRSTVQIKWGEVGEQKLRLGYEGEVDMELIENGYAYGPYFYPNHLPMVSVGAHLRLINKILSCEKISRKEVMDEGENAINYLNELLSSTTCDHESKAILCRIKREIQEQQHEIDKSENIKTQLLLASLQQDEDSQSDSTSQDVFKAELVEANSTTDISLETNSLQNGKHFDSASTDVVDSGGANKSNVANLVSKFSAEGGQKEAPLSENEQECGASEVGLGVSWIIRKFNQMTSYISNMYTFDSKPVYRAPHVGEQIPTLPASQDKKQDMSDDTSFPNEKAKNENEVHSKPYLSKFGDQKSMQDASHVVNKEDTFDDKTSSGEKFKKIRAKFAINDENANDAASPVYMVASSKKSSLPNSEKKSIQRAQYGDNEIPPSQVKKQGNFGATTTLYQEKPKKEDFEFQTKEGTNADTEYVRRLVHRFERNT